MDGVLIDDINELNLDRPTIPLKTAEELESLTVDEKLTGIERAVYLLSSGQDVQRISVVTALPTLLTESNEECMKRVVPKVREVLHVAQQDMQLAAATSFLEILSKKLVAPPVFANTFLKTIIQNVDNKDTESAAAWLSTLLSVIELLPKDLIKTEVLGVAVNKGQLQKPVCVRLSCCKILGKIATKFDPPLIKKELLPVVQQLCQDVEHEVRACMCGQLDLVAKGLGLENMRMEILPELRELTNDEESNVRIAVLDTIVNMLPMLDSEIKREVIIPLMCDFCERALHAEDSTMPAFARYIGKLCHELKDDLTEEMKHLFIDNYKKLCKVGAASEKSKGPQKAEALSLNLDPSKNDCKSFPGETRTNAAYNMPAMALFVKNFRTDLLPTLKSLVHDPRISVRKTTASGFHVITEVMGCEATLLFPELVSLLNDESIEVLHSVINTLPPTLDILHKNRLTDSKGIQEVVTAFLDLEGVVFESHNWRVQESMVHSLGCLGKICSQDDLYNQVIPILFNRMKNGRALPVRYAAAWSMLVLMRQLHKHEHRDVFTSKLIVDFCQGRSCARRSLFIVICSYVIKLYSKAFFKEHFFQHVLPLTSDPVPNIRMHACLLLPALKRLIKLPYDNDLKGSLEQCVRKMLISQEKDRDVAIARTKAVDEMDKIPVQMESVVSLRKNFEDDTDDQMKEEEEKAWLVLEEKERKDEAAKPDKRHMKKESTPSRGAPNKKVVAGGFAKIGSKELMRQDSRGSTCSSSSVSTSHEPSSSKPKPASLASQSGKTGTSRKGSNK